ncbi:MAG: S-adenosylmethionine transporter [Peltula sp. TS41687]|nr:MAG: S-adenosylmethionine transporter [Peltula sp. TS41687]
MSDQTSYTRALIVSYPSIPNAQQQRTNQAKAGGIAGTAVDLSLYPIDTIKTRLQSSAGFARSGGFHGIYRGVGSALVGSAPGAALFFVTYERCKALLSQNSSLLGGHGTRSSSSSSSNEAITHMIAASLGEVAACVVRVPTEVVKQRAQASQHPSSWATLQAILRRREVGLSGVRRELYRGWSITVMREVPFTMVQFPLWEGMKRWRMDGTGRDTVSGLESGVFGSVAGAVAAGITTPLDVLKTRMMLATERERMMPLLRSILTEAGPAPLFAGIGPRILWISAGGAIFLGSYQWAYNALSGVT